MGREHIKIKVMGVTRLKRKVRRERAEASRRRTELRIQFFKAVV
jgi:hypothetical protein